jgi:Helicase conserved C-terminal domain
MRLWCKYESTCDCFQFDFKELSNFEFLLQFFLEYQHLQNKEDRIEYQRNNRSKIITRGQCCYKYPKLVDGGGAHPKAVLWRQQHPDDQPCDKCPSCTLFGAMSILYKLCSHAALLQVKIPPERLEPGSTQHGEALRQLERARCFIPSDLLSKFPGGYYFENSIMDNHFALSGKMAVLDKLLRAINAQLGRVLLFAHSTKTLDLIENYIMSMGGYSYLRMDGQTANAKRKEIADKFRASSQTFVFLLSTRAMGLGLNLTQVRFFSLL